MSVHSIRAPITLGDFIPAQIEEEQPKPLAQLFQERTRLTKQIHCSRSHSRARNLRRQLRVVNQEISRRERVEVAPREQQSSSITEAPVREQQSSSNSEASAREQQVSSSIEAPAREQQSASSSAAPAREQQVSSNSSSSEEPIRLIAPGDDQDSDGSVLGVLGAVSAIALGVLGIGAMMSSSSGNNSLNEMTNTLNSIVESVKSLPTRESSIALIKSIRETIKADKIIQSWSPSVRRSFNRAIDELIRHVNNGRLLEGITYSISSGSNFWGVKGAFELIASWMK